MTEEPQTIQRLPELAKVRIEDRRNPFPMTAVVQVVDFYPIADKIISRTAASWEVK